MSTDQTAGATAPATGVYGPTAARARAESVVMVVDRARLVRYPVARCDQHARCEHDRVPVRRPADARQRLLQRDQPRARHRVHQRLCRPAAERCGVPHRRRRTQHCLSLPEGASRRVRYPASRRLSRQARTVATPGAITGDNVDQPFRPKYTLTFSPSWTAGALTLSYNLRWQDGVRRFAKVDTDANPSLVDPRYLRYKEVWQHDVQAEVAVNARFSFYGGVNNLADQKPTSASRPTCRSRLSVGIFMRGRRSSTGTVGS